MANGQTVITYGSWALARCQTLEFRQEPVYDDSQTDLMYHRFTVKVLGYIHNRWISSNWCQLAQPQTNRTSGDTSAAVMQIGMRLNLPPRQTFSMRTGADSSGTSGGYLLLYGVPVPSTFPSGISHLDVNNGPRCKEFLITRVVGDNVFEVQAEFEVCKVECSTTEAPYAGSSGTAWAGSAPGVTSGVLSNRWSAVDGVDATLRTTRTYNGRLRVASNNINPQMFRSYVTPPLVQGMRRDRIQFGVSPDGLCLDYTIVDQEVAQSAPDPAKRWSVQHTETVGEGMLTHSSIDIMLAGARDVDKGALIMIGLNIIQAKVLGDKPNRDARTHFMESLSITDMIGDEQIVTLSARTRRQKDNQVNDWRIASKILGKPLTKTQMDPDHAANVDLTNYDPNRSYGGRDVGGGTIESPYYQGPVKLVGMFLPYLQSPCVDAHKIVPDYYGLPSDTNITAPGTPSPSITALVDPTLGYTDDLYSTSHLDSVYTHWQMESIYDEKEMKIALPIAGSGYGLSSSSANDTCKIVTLARPQARRVVRLEAERVGKWPEMPSGAQLEAIVGPASSGGSAIIQQLTRKRRRFATPRYTAGGQKVYRIACDFYFALNRQPQPSEALAVGRSMWTVDGDIDTDTTATAGWT